MLGAPAYRRKGPSPVLLRILGPVLVILTLVLLSSGVGLLLLSSTTAWDRERRERPCA